MEGPTYQHCKKCGRPTISKSEYCCECNPKIPPRITLYFPHPGMLKNVKYLASRKGLNLSKYCSRIIQDAINKEISDINKKMKR